MQLLTPTIKSKLVSWNPMPYLRSFFQTEVREEILQGIDTRLLYLNGELINLETKAFEQDVPMEAEALAQAAKKLLPTTANGLKNNSKNQQQNTSIALFLPLTEFIYTAYDLGAVDSSNIKAALNYQRDELLPGSSDDLKLTVAHQKQQNNFALWFSQQNAQDLFQAFVDSGLTLSAILPRMTLLANKGHGLKSEIHVVREKADNYLAHIGFLDNSLVQLGHISDSDIAVDEFRKEWEDEFGLVDSNIHCLQDKQDWFEQISDNLNQDIFRSTQYAYFPSDISQRFKSRGRLRNSRVIGLLAFIIAFVIAVPFIVNEVRYLKEESKYQRYWKEAKDVRMMREVIFKNEDDWALFLNYPQANVMDILNRLNSIIPVNSWISSFELKNGYVEIDGYSPNPTAILEVISAQNDFDEVAFNQNILAQRGKDKERFGITFHIKGLNVEKFEKEYLNQDE